MIWRARRTEKELPEEPERPMPSGPSAEQAWRALGLVIDWVRHAETKSAATLAASGVVAGVLYNIVHNDSTPSVLILVFGSVCGACSVAAAFCAGWSLRPRLWLKDEPTSNLYFDHIARRHAKGGGNAAYVEALKKLSANDDELIVEIASQIWSNAHVARQKYRWGSIGLTLLLLSLVPLAATAFVVTF